MPPSVYSFGQNGMYSENLKESTYGFFLQNEGEEDYHTRAYITPAFMKKILKQPGSQSEPLHRCSKFQSF
jgi:hypothetical protein